MAADVGIAKASLYKQAASKEALAAAAMARLLHQSLALTEPLAARSDLNAFERVQSLTRWALETQLAGEMPILPSQNSSLRAALMGNRDYVDSLLHLSELLGGWIVQAQADGDLDNSLPPEVVMYTVFARACDPVPAFLKAAGNHSDEQIVNWVLSTCMNGLRSR